MLRTPAALLLALTCVAAQDGGRDPWTRLSASDADGDGRVTRAEFSGPARVFERFDLDRDGVLTETEVRAAARRAPAESAPLERLDPDGDGRLSREEWLALFARADADGDGKIDAAEWAAFLRGDAPDARPGDGAPRVGDPAPRVSARPAAGGQPVDLAQVSRPTVLVFGSWT